MVGPMSGSEKLSDSQQAEAALRESEEHYRAVAEAATDAIITIDSDSTILVVNPATERIFGYSVEEYRPYQSRLWLLSSSLLLVTRRDLFRGLLSGSQRACCSPRGAYS